MSNEQTSIDQTAAQITAEANRKLRLLKDAAEQQVADDLRAARALCEHVASPSLEVEMARDSRALTRLRTPDYLALVERYILRERATRDLGVDPALLSKLQRDNEALRAENDDLRAKLTAFDKARPTQTPPQTMADLVPHIAPTIERLSAPLMALQLIAGGQYRWQPIRKALAEAGHGNLSPDSLDDCLMACAVSAPRPTYLVEASDTGLKRLDKELGIQAQSGYVGALLAHHGDANVVHSVLCIAPYLSDADLFPTREIATLRPSVVTLREGPILVMSYERVPDPAELAAYLEQNACKLYAVCFETKTVRLLTKRFTQACEDSKVDGALFLANVTILSEGPAGDPWTVQKAKGHLS